jgi:hypothetical protein
LGARDLKILGLTLIPVLLLVLFAYMAPVYMLQNGTYERHWRWNAPVIQIRHGYDDMKPEDIERLSKDPHQKEILDNMKNLPRTRPCTPIYIGSRRGPGRNWVGYLAMLSVITWCVVAGQRWFSR